MDPAIARERLSRPPPGGPTDRRRDISMLPSRASRVRSIRRCRTRPASCWRLPTTMWCRTPPGSNGSRARSRRPVQTSWPGASCLAGRARLRRGCRPTSTACSPFLTTGRLACGSPRLTGRASSQSAPTWRYAAAVMRRVGGFRSDLGKLAGTLRTGEDHELCLRMLHAGCRGIYEPTALVHHWVARERLERRYFRQWLYQNGRDVARVDASYPPSTPQLFGVPRYLWREAAADIWGAIRWTVSGDRAAGFAAALRTLRFAATCAKPGSGPGLQRQARLYERIVGLGTHLHLQPRLSAARLAAACLAH